MEKGILGLPSVAVGAVGVPVWDGGGRMLESDCNSDAVDCCAGCGVFACGAGGGCAAGVGVPPMTPLFVSAARRSAVLEGGAALF